MVMMCMGCICVVYGVFCGWVVCGVFCVFCVCGVWGVCGVCCVCGVIGASGVRGVVRVFRGVCLFLIYIFAFTRSYSFSFPVFSFLNFSPHVTSLLSTSITFSFILFYSPP